MLGLWSRLSLRVKLPLLVGGLVLLVVATFSWAAYQNMGQAAVDGARQRLDTPRTSRRRLTPNFDPEAVGRFDRFLRGLVDVVVGKYDGALKAEHGSGRNMAPFVRDEWGDRAYGVMQMSARTMASPQCLRTWLSGTALRWNGGTYLRRIGNPSQCSPTS